MNILVSKSLSNEGVGLLPETARVLKHLLGQEKSLSEGTECDHNILIESNCDHQDTQWNPFHTQAAEEIICPFLIQE